MLESLPREITFDILCRLPITSLLQSKLVCKTWHNIILDPLLVSMYSARKTGTDPCLILHSDNPVENQLFCFDLSNSCNDQRVSKIRVPTLPEFNIVGSCKGLLCLCDSSTKDTLFVYNPLSGEYTELPKPVELLQQSPVFGFGFDQITKVYKVVKAVYPKLTLPMCGLYYPTAEVQILSLGSDVWRNLNHLNYPIHQKPSQVEIRGRIHWTSRPDHYFIDNSDCLIISFDLSDENFREVSGPNLNGFRWPNFHLVDIGGCLSVAVRDTHANVDIWIMKDYGVKGSWILEYRIGNHVPRGLEDADLKSDQRFRDSKVYRRSSLVRVLGVLKNEKVLMLYKCRSLVTYDARNGIFEDLSFEGLPHCFEAVVLQGSLHWIDILIGDV